MNFIPSTYLSLSIYIPAIVPTTRAKVASPPRRATLLLAPYPISCGGSTNYSGYLIALGQSAGALPVLFIVTVPLLACGTWQTGASVQQMWRD